MKDLKKYLEIVKKTLQRVLRYGGFLTIIGFLLIYIYLVLTISIYANKTPSQESIDEKLQAITLPKIDQTSIDRITRLRDQNVKVKTLFDKARQNPFSE